MICEVCEVKLPYRVKHPLYRLFRKYGHPELMNPYVVDLMYQYVRDCKVIYDPFAGVGTTMLLLRHLPHLRVILADIEEKFVNAMKEVAEVLGFSGKVEIVCHDSVSVSMKVDCVFTSPSFLTINRGGGIYRDGYWRNGKPVDTELPFRHARQYSNNSRNLSNVKGREYWERWGLLVKHVDAMKWIIHGKDIVRKGKLVETWRYYVDPLLRRGYKLIKYIKLVKDRREVSFWQRLLKKRGLPYIDYEWVIILKRGD